MSEHRPFVAPPAPEIPEGPDPCCPLSEAISGTWLVEVHEHCTCGMGPGGYYGAHEPGCGMAPLMDLSTLPGFEQITKGPIAQALRTAASEMPGPSSRHNEVWDGEQVQYVGWESAPNDRTPQTWLLQRANEVEHG